MAIPHWLVIVTRRAKRRVDPGGPGGATWRPPIGCRRGVVGESAGAGTRGGRSLAAAGDVDARAVTVAARNRFGRPNLAPEYGISGYKSPGIPISHLFPFLLEPRGLGEGEGDFVRGGSNREA